jgi:shikimate kinase
MELKSKESKNQIILTGFMGSGKTTTGEKLALLLGRKFIDTDREIEESCGMSVTDLFSLQGEASFREKETEIIRRLVNYAPGSLVVATGGGALISRQNREILENFGLLVLLEASPRTLLWRTRLQGGRPLLEGSSKPLKKIAELLDKRAVYYETCDLKVDTTGKKVDQVVAEIVAKLKTLNL